MGTVPTDLDGALARLANAAGPEDLFGPRPRTGDADALQAARRNYRNLARLVHPDRCPSRREDATAGFARLSALWTAFAGAGPADPPTITTRRNSYTLGRRFARGDIANLYEATRTPRATRSAHTGPATADTVSSTDRVLLKMPRDPRNNDLLDTEAEHLTHLARTVDPAYAAYLPQLVETFRHRDTRTGVDRRVNALARLDGFHTLAEVAAAYPAGLDARDAAWMWRRLLVALGAVHRAGLVHGAVLPDHVLIHPAQHGLVLTDFAYATAGAPIVAVASGYRSWYPDEVTGKQPPGPGTDIAMATRAMTTLMGDRTPRPLRAFAAGCTLRNLPARPDDAWALLGELDELLERLYGPRRFRPFTMPATTSSTS